jgi:hypothetical protein
MIYHIIDEYQFSPLAEDSMVNLVKIKSCALDDSNILLVTSLLWNVLYWIWLEFSILEEFISDIVVISYATPSFIIYCFRLIYWPNSSELFTLASAIA